MKAYSVLIVSLCCLLLVACNSSSYTYSPKSKAAAKKSLVQFKEDPLLSSTFEEAEESGKYVFIDFYTDYCPPCKVMDKEVFSNPDLAAYLNDHFINVKINAGKQKGANLASLYNVKAFPTLIFTDFKGNMIMKKEGGTSVSTLKYMAEEVRQSLVSR
jgi:thioredoxin-related protein